MIEEWEPLPGLGDKYRISNLGRVKCVSFLQRYNHWRTRQELFRRTKERILSQQRINSGYLVVHLWHGDKRYAFTVHRLVAKAFCPGFFEGADVNHLDFNKTNNSAHNLEWASRKNNINYSISAGRSPQARPFVDVLTGVRYPSIAQAAKGMRKTHRTIRKMLCLQ